MRSDRLNELENFLELLHEQKVSLEREALLARGLARTQAEQRLRTEVKPAYEGEIDLKTFFQPYFPVFRKRNNPL